MRYSAVDSDSSGLSDTEAAGTGGDAPNKRGSKRITSKISLVGGHTDVNGHTDLSGVNPLSARTAFSVGVFGGGGSGSYLPGARKNSTDKWQLYYLPRSVRYTQVRECVRECVNVLQERGHVYMEVASDGCMPLATHMYDYTHRMPLPAPL